ncbi:MAG: HPr kinase/phosphorylase [Limnobacter sp.]|uniref:HPr(Ser) kinase/phosphatase n=1 Tax=unclassified Limnobacter TaxID=2630203 RepID=UPI000156C801|nr:MULTISPECIES: HPr(Ser) kinase/phosphatase [unclassified Limnobacter]EDM85097.1 HPr kinase/phosphorylase [Limnobacter sp. MED105]MDZ4048802.1 HPr(Ser) kinase/phosphatase [Limnobacter sp.]RZO90675.1 MAG: HPr kinase/phosphorylase [Limnobacter sp.]
MKQLKELIEANRNKLKLDWLAGLNGGDRHLDLQCFASSDLVGHLNTIHPGRIQVFGRQEIEYFARISDERKKHQIDKLIEGDPPAIIVAESFQPHALLKAACDESNIPLLATPLSAAEIIDFLRVYINKWLAPTTMMHGVFMDVLGMGVLICGESGLGKSELGLELISRGHGLVADDVVEFSRVAPNLIEGRCPELIRNLMEVRGVGLLDIKAIFGETAVRRKMRLKLIVHLVRKASLELHQERLVTEQQFQEVLGLPIRKAILPVAAGRNLAVLLEAAVRNTILQMRGINTLDEFMVRQQKAMLTELGGIDHLQVDPDTETDIGHD